MGKVKAWIMDLEEQFYDKVDENDLCVDSFDEFVAIATNSSKESTQRSLSSTLS